MDDDYHPPALLDATARPPVTPPTLTELATALGMDHLGARAASLAAQSAGVGTVAAYRSAMKGYAAWCQGLGRAPVSGDPGLLALYLTQRQIDGLAISSLKVIRAAVVAAHRLADVPFDGTDRRLGMMMEGASRAAAGATRRQAAPAVPDVLRRLLAALPSPRTPAAAAPALAARHRAMLLVGFGAALRRSEIVALTVGDVAIERRGLLVTVRRSKTDPHGTGRRLAIWANPRDPGFCPVVAVEAWLAFRCAGKDAAVVGEIPPALSAWADQMLFCGVTLGGRVTGTPMSDKIVARLIKQACQLAGLDPTRFSGHSLRRGLLTNAGDLQLPLVDVMRQSRHKSVETALSYIEDGDAWRNNITEPVFK